LRGALHSPSTGIVDSHALMLSLQGDLENAGGMVALKSPITRAECCRMALSYLIAEDGTALRCRSVVNAAGSGAPALAARFDGPAVRADSQAYFAKGNYFTLSGGAVRPPHLSRARGRVAWACTSRSTWAARPSSGPTCNGSLRPTTWWWIPRAANGFYAEVRKYWPALPDGALIPGYAGMRPKISGPGEPAADFVIDGPEAHGVPGLVNLFGIESPGLTSSLAISRHVARLLAHA
jgi:L-2-hydroxyglutarate oxidase LhgO